MPLFNPDYLAGYNDRIFKVTQLIHPESETLELKIISRRIHETFNGLLDLMNRLSGYIALAKLEQTISQADFGIKYLRKSITSHDAEGVIQGVEDFFRNFWNQVRLPPFNHPVAPSVIRHNDFRARVPQIYV